MEPIRFGKFLLIEQIAAGGMAEIFRAVSIASDGYKYPLAIKRILPHFSSDAEFISMLIDEAKLMVFLNHPNIVPIVEFGKIDDSYYIAMDYIEGTTLKGLFRKVRERGERFEINVALYIVREIACGLAYAHRKTDRNSRPLEIVHRDISPANILLSFDGEIKIADFGISKAANQSHRTQAGIIRGKTGYMSPEQTEAGGKVDSRSDIYSLGIILYELLTGRRLYKADSVPEALRLIREGVVPSVRSLRPQVNPALEIIVSTMLAFSSRERYQSCEAVIDAIDEYQARFDPGGRVNRIMQADFIKFLSIYYHSEIDAATNVARDIEFSEAKTKVETAIKNLQRKEEQKSSQKNDSVLETIAVNPQFEESQSKSIVSSLSIKDDEPTGEVLEQKEKSLSSLLQAPTGVIHRARQFSWKLFFVGVVAFIFGASLAYVFRNYDHFKLSFFLKRLKSTVVDQSKSTGVDGEEMDANSKDTIQKTSTTIAKTHIYITSEPVSANLYVGKGQQPVGVTPFDLLVDIGKKVDFRLEAAGYETKRAFVQVYQEGKITKTIWLTPAKKVIKTRQLPDVQPPQKLGVGNNQKSRNVVRTGELSVSTVPWSEVFVDGQKIGVAPFMNFKIREGKRRIKLSNSILKLKPFEKVMVVRSGQIVKCIYNFDTRQGDCK